MLTCFPVFHDFVAVFVNMGHMGATLSKRPPPLPPVAFESLALLCATAQQNYCRHPGVRCLSVRKAHLSETVMGINAKFC